MSPLLTQSVQDILLKNLDKLEEELKLYPSESSIWIVEGHVKNSAGNLCLHLCGNLQHYIGAVLGRSGYLRNRDKEFSLRDIPREQLFAEIGKARQAITSTLPTLTEHQLLSTYPEEVFGWPMTTLYFLVHLSTHLGYHLGQVNYHRRLVPKQESRLAG